MESKAYCKSCEEGTSPNHICANNNVCKNKRCFDMPSWYVGFAVTDKGAVYFCQVCKRKKDNK